MKKILSLICAGMLLSALCAGFFACKKEISLPDPAADCWVFVKTIPGEEMILLAQSGLTTEEGFAISDGYKAEYGEDNVRWSVDFPGGINDLELDEFEIEPDAVTNCYELTMTIDFSDMEMPSRESLLGYGFRAVRINGATAVCKKYFWAYTEEGAIISEDFLKRSFNRYYHGQIVHSSYENLGPELHDEPIVF